TEGIVRARYRNSPSNPEFLVPGKIYQYKIDLWSTSNVFLKGHRIRVEISSSNFPRFDRNLNSGKDAKTDVDPVKATNTIYHDGEHPSTILLPVVYPLVVGLEPGSVAIERGSLGHCQFSRQGSTTTNGACAVVVQGACRCLASEFQSK